MSALYVIKEGRKMQACLVNYVQQPYKSETTASDTLHIGDVKVGACHNN